MRAIRGTLLRTIGIIASLALCAGCISAAPHAAEKGSRRGSGEVPRLRARDVSAASAVVIERTGTQGGRLIWSKRPNARRSTASTYKMALAALAIERGVLGVRVRVGSVGGRHSPVLEQGDVVQARDLLTLMMLPSDNGASFALSELVAGCAMRHGEMNDPCRVRAARMMDRFARAAGASDRTTLTSMVSTARDLALIADRALGLAEFARVVSQPSAIVRLRRDGTRRSIRVRSTNRLLGRFRGATGVKTGTSVGACANQVSSATRDGRSFIAVVMGSTGPRGCALKASDRARFRDSKRVLRYAFSTATL